VPLHDSDQCCGSAGIYNLIEPDTSDAVLAPKLANIRATRAPWTRRGAPFSRASAQPSTQFTRKS